MVEVDTAAIFARLYAATDGVWEYRLANLHMGFSDYRLYRTGKPGYFATITSCQADVEFMVHAKQDIEALLNRVSELEIENQRLMEAARNYTEEDEW